MVLYRVDIASALPVAVHSVDCRGTLKCRVHDAGGTVQRAEGHAGATREPRDTGGATAPLRTQEDLRVRRGKARAHRVLDAI